MKNKFEEKVERKLNNSFGKIRRDMDNLNEKVNKKIDKIITILNGKDKINQSQKQEDLSKREIIRKKKDITLKRRGFKKQEVKFSIIKTIEENKDFCTIEIEEKILEDYDICRATFYNYLKELKWTKVIKEKDMDGNKGYIIIKENQRIYILTLLLFT